MWMVDGKWHGCVGKNSSQRRFLDEKLGFPPKVRATEAGASQQEVVIIRVPVASCIIPVCLFLLTGCDAQRVPNRGSRKCERTANTSRSTTPNTTLPTPSLKQWLFGLAKCQHVNGRQVALHTLVLLRGGFTERGHLICGGLSVDLFVSAHPVSPSPSGRLAIRHTAVTILTDIDAGISDNCRTMVRPDTSKSLPCKLRARHGSERRLWCRQSTLRLKPPVPTETSDLAVKRVRND